jgi:intracellular sulfur oxidation DsrE/DsrF family protein
VRAAGDRVDAAAGTGNPFVRGPRGWSFGELQARHVSFFACNNALADLARRTGTTPDVLRSHVLPGMMVVPAGVAAINALQEERFTLFVANA